MDAKNEYISKNIESLSKAFVKDISDLEDVWTYCKLSMKPTISNIIRTITLLAERYKSAYIYNDVVGVWIKHFPECNN
jgi:hypothetical protein